MSAYTQQDRRLTLATPLGEDVLLLTKVEGEEGISRLFQFSLHMSSTQDSIAAKDIVGKNVTFSIRQTNGELRYFNGIVRTFSYRGEDDRFQLYAMEVVPWLWMLTKSSDCRIFQNKSVVEIIEQVFSDLGMTTFEKTEIQGTHDPRDYCTQYRETDFEFVSRLMEEEGIFYYFRHEDGKHTLVLADQKDAYKDAAEAEVEFKSNLSQTDAADQILAWEHQFEMRTGRYTHTDYNFETPSANLLSSTKTVVKLDNIETLENYDFPGNYAKKGDGDAEIKLRMEAEEAGYESVLGSSGCASFGPGLKFKLTGHHAEGEEASYAITNIRHSALQPASYVTGGEVESQYTNTFRCIPATIVFRPTSDLDRPRIQGVQTAVVVGPAGQEIYTDKYGRIKVQFFWDRQGKMDENSSCWIRVAQAWAGKNWGAIFLPRIGHEVVVSFLEGDPDRPLITGSVYNAEQLPPYTLPDKKTISTTKTLSTLGGGGFNEIRFDDNKGNEQVFFHAAKQMDIRVEENRFETITGSRNLVVEVDKLEHIKNKRHELVDVDHIEQIKNDRNLTVGGKEAVAITGSKSLEVDGDVIEEFKSNHSEVVTQDYYLKGDNVVIEGMTNVTIKVGDNYIAIDSSGITIGTPGGTIELNANQKISITSDTDAISLQAASNIETQSAMLSLQASSQAALKGGIVMIN